MAERPPIDYDAIKADRARGLSDHELAAKYKTTDRSIRRTRARDEAEGKPWPAQGAAVYRGGPDDKVVQFPRAAPQAKPTQLSEAAAAEITDVDVAQELLAAAYKGLRDYRRGLMTPGQHQSHADVLASLATSAARAITASRDVAGKKPGLPSGEIEKPLGSGITIRHEMLEPRIVPVDERGRALEETA